MLKWKLLMSLLQIMPAFAVLAGNDYVKLEKNETFPDWGEEVPGQTRPAGRLGGLLSRLRGFQEAQVALKELLGLMGDLEPERREEVFQILSEAMEGYKIRSCSLMSFLKDGTAPPLPDVEVLPLPNTNVPINYS